VQVDCPGEAELEKISEPESPTFIVEYEGNCGQRHEREQIEAEQPVVRIE